MRHIYTSVDVGSDTIKIVVCELFQGKLNLLAASSYPSKGIKNGLIVDVDAAEESVLKAMSEIEAMLGLKIKSVIASVPSYYASFTAIQGKIEVNGTVTADDITEVLSAAYKTKRIENKEMVTIIPIDFGVDGKEKVKDPKGLETSILSARAIMVSVPKKNIYSVVGLLERIGLEVVDIMVGSIGDVNTYKTKENASLVGAIINIGAETTSISIYNKSIVIKNSILGMGGRNIDHDIAYIYKLKPNDAIKLKETFALASKKYASANEFLEVVDKFGSIRKISQKEISELSQSILEEILVLARKEINLLTKQPVDYIIITGGTSNMSNFDVLTEEVLGTIAHVGSIKIPGVRSNHYATALGNIVYFINKLKLKGIDYTMIDDHDIDSLSNDHKGFASISSESMLGKVFGYFFDE